MAETIAMPKLGFDMAEGTLVRWLIAEGETVQKGQVLAEIETDKATVEVESTAGGILARRMVEEGAVVPVGDPIAVIAAPGEKVDLEPAKPAEAEPAEEAEETPAAVPAETKKTPTSNTEEIKDHPAAVEEPVAQAGDERVKASPLAKRMAAEAGLLLGKVAGSGPGGRVVKRDVEQAMATPGVAAAVGTPAAKMPTWQPGAAPLPDQRISLGRLRAIIGKRMLESKQQVPHFYVTNEIDARQLMSVRKQANDYLSEDEKISVNDFVVKSAAMVLRQFPNLNASLDGQEIIHHGRINIGVAVAVEGGLLTVVCKDADQKPLRLLAQEIKGMVTRARQGKVRPEDIEGSTFSISNLGMYDVEQFSAIINPPEAAILAVSSVLEVPVVENGEIKPGLRMKLTLSVDHRISDGVEGAQFMQALKAFLENPVRLLI